MAKGNRQRANKLQNEKGEMRAKGTTPPAKPVQVETLSDREGLYFKELGEINNVLAKLRQQYGNYEFILNTLNQKRNDIQTGKIKPQVWKLLTPTSFYLVEDKQEILKELDEEIIKYNTSIKAVTLQVKQYEDAYKESGLRLEEFARRKFGKYRVSTISNDRRTIQSEEVLFEAEFDKIAKDPKLQEQFKQASKAAKELNRQKLAQTVEQVSVVKEVKPETKAA